MRSDVRVAKSNAGLSIQTPAGQIKLQAGSLSVAYLNSYLVAQFKQLKSNLIANEDYGIGEGDIQTEFGGAGSKHRQDSDVLQDILARKQGKCVPKLWEGYTEVSTEHITDENGLPKIKEADLPKVYYIVVEYPLFAAMVKTNLEKNFQNVHLHTDKKKIIITNWADADKYPPMLEMTYKPVQITLNIKAAKHSGEKNDNEKKVTTAQEVSTEYVPCAVTLPTGIVVKSSRELRETLKEQGVEGDDKKKQIAAYYKLTTANAVQESLEKVLENFAKKKSDYLQAAAYVKQPNILTAFKQALPSLGTSNQKITTLLSNYVRNHVEDQMITADTLPELFTQLGNLIGYSFSPEQEFALFTSQKQNFKTMLQQVIYLSPGPKNV
jgi:hypothetical protein